MTPGREVSVIGCDDVPQSALLDPPLSTIRLDFFGVGRRACEAMLQVLDDRAGSRIADRMAVELVNRESCAPVK
jgi:DNA-binding LacI/PurR family transcriptional regulator